VQDSGLKASQIKTIVVGTGPAPFTGLRAGIVSAKALAFATGAELLGQDVLEPQAWWDLERVPDASPRLVLALNDARRKQLYFQLFMVQKDGGDPRGGRVTALSDMDIQYPQTVVETVVALAAQHGGPAIAVDIIGHGAEKYSSAWENLAASGVNVGDVVDESVLHSDGARGLEIFAKVALQKREDGVPTPTDPLYLRRPDVALPPPLKPVLKVQP
jgi:tRNA threonylcarbamoyl adenosine modification protein YeaZ